MSGMPNRNKRLTLEDLVKLLDNPAFISDSHSFHKKYSDQFLRTAQIPGEWERQWPAFSKDALRPFIKKWGAYPPDKHLLASPKRYKAHYAVMKGLWGIIPVYPWTTRKEIEARARQIHRLIGTKHESFLEDRRVHIAEWLSRYRNAVTGKAPRTIEIATVVWGRTVGLTRSSKSKGLSKLSVQHEKALMKSFLAKGMSYKEAERLVYKRAQGTEAPASAMVRMARRRIKHELTELMREVRDPTKSDRPGHALTMLLRELLLMPYKPYTPPDIEVIYEKAAKLGNALTDMHYLRQGSD
jgi:hypothetical protein